MYLRHPSTDISAEYQPSIDRVSADIRSSVGRYVGHALVDTSIYISTDTRSMYRRILSEDYRPILSTDTIDTIDRVSADTRSTCRSVYRSTLDRHLDCYVMINCPWHIGRLSVVYRSTAGGSNFLSTSFYYDVSRIISGHHQLNARCTNRNQIIILTCHLYTVSKRAV